MSITDELREWAEQRKGLRLFDMQLKAIADRIDAEHEKACDDAWNNGYEADYLGIEKLLTEHPQAMELHGWVRLPKDADGVPIRFKDKVTVPWSDKVYEVGGFSYQENVNIGTMTIWINTHIDGKYRALCATDSCHHHTPDTWERIIEDALDGYHDTDFEALVARCKALAGEPTP